MSTRIGWRLSVLTASALAFVVLAGSSPALAQRSAAATAVAVGSAPSAPAAAPAPASTAPGPVTRVTATAVTKTSLTISWANPVSSTYTGVMIRRTTGSSPASTPTSGSLVSDVRRPGTRVVSTGLTPGVTYTYALFAHDASGHYAARAVTTARTNAANGPLSWGPARSIDPFRGLLYAVSCPSVAFCMAVDLHGNALIFNGTSWGPPKLLVHHGGTLEDVSCVSSTFCMAAAADGDVLTFNGTKWLAPTSPVSGMDGDVLLQVSCTSPSWCMGLTYYGYATIYNGVSWSAETKVAATAPDGASLQSLSCRSSGSTHLCAVINGDNELMYYAGGRWTGVKPVASSALRSVSCGSVTFCMAIADTGAVRFNGSTWGPPTPLDHPINGFISCLPTQTCTAIDRLSGDTISYNGSTWTGPTPTGFKGSTDLSCATPTFCVAVETFSDALTLRGTTWSASTIDPLHGGLESISCTSQSFCVAVSQSGDELNYNGRSWSAAHSIAYRLNAVSCTSATFCMAVGITPGTDGIENGQAIRFDGHRWTATTFDLALDLDAVSCASSSFCMAVGGQYFTIYNGTSWSTPQLVPGADGLAAVSCPSASFCMAVDGSGNALIHLASGWGAPVPMGIQGGAAVSCVNPSFCMGVESYSPVTDQPFGANAVQFNGRSWQTPVVIDRHAEAISTVSCASATYCIAGDGVPYPGGANVTRFDGTRWVTPVRVDDGYGVANVSCPTISFCMAVTYDGDAIQAGFGPPCGATPSTTSRAWWAGLSPAQQKRIKSALVNSRLGAGQSLARIVGEIRARPGA